MKPFEKEHPTQEEIDLYCLNDSFGPHCGMHVVEVGDDYAVATMTVEKYHLNARGIPHGGMYLTLADMTFGAAVHYATQAIVTLDSTAEFIASAKIGDVLTCTSRRHSSGRTIERHDVEIRDQNGKVLTIVHVTGFKLNK